MARKRRGMEVFSMSFLDCMSCGFGAVILFFMIINSQTKHDAEAPPDDLKGQTTKLEIEILEQRKNMVLAKNSMERLKDEKIRAEDQIAQIIALIEKLKKELEKLDNTTLAKIESVEKLKSDIERLEEEKKRLLAIEAERKTDGSNVRRFTGDGDRQYLTGLKVGGERILVLVDSSASMLDRKIVNILRRRNMSDAVKLRSLKWRQAVASVASRGNRANRANRARWVSCARASRHCASSWRSCCKNCASAASARGSKARARWISSAALERPWVMPRASWARATRMAPSTRKAARSKPCDGERRTWLSRCNSRE